jgi:hypothetical protein
MERRAKHVQKKAPAAQSSEFALFFTGSPANSMAGLTTEYFIRLFGIVHFAS